MLRGWRKHRRGALDTVGRDPKLKHWSLDLCEVYKYMHRHYKSNAEQFFSHPRRVLRGHSLKLQKEQTNSDTRKYYFSNRVHGDWNGLPKDVVNAPSLSGFKKRWRSLPEWQEG